MSVINTVRLMATFLAIKTSSVPGGMENAESKIVFPRLIEGRSDGELSLVVHDGLTLNLRRSSAFADDFDLTSHVENIKVVYKVSLRSGLPRCQEEKVKVVGAIPNNVTLVKHRMHSAKHATTMFTTATTTNFVYHNSALSLTRPFWLAMTAFVFP